MTYRSLREFVARLESERELVRVTEPVSTILEMTEIQTRLLAERGPAVIFENAIMNAGARSPLPVLANLFGTTRRVAMGVTMGGIERHDAKSLREVGELLATLRQPDPPRSVSEAFGLLPLAKNGHGNASENGEARAMPRDRIRGCADRSVFDSRSNLLARRTSAIDYLAAGRNQRPRRIARG
jgi:UbiD family decarboxylase